MAARYLCHRSAQPDAFGRGRVPKNRRTPRSRTGFVAGVRGELWAKRRTDVKKAMTCLVITGMLGGVTAPAFAQTAKPTAAASSVSRTTKAVNFRRAGGST